MQRHPITNRFRFPLPTARFPLRTAWILLVMPLSLTAWQAVPPGVVRGELPRVHFDVGFTVACRDVTPPEYREMHPEERLVEARFQVTSFIETGDAEELIEFLYTLESPRKTLRVVDYEPKTTLESNVAGNVSVEKKKENALTLGLGISGNLQHAVNANASGSALKKTLSSVRYDLLPPKELLAASGTLQRGHAVYFKLKPSKRTSLEGAKDFVLVFRVPRDWQADYLHLKCQAFSNRRGAVYQLHEAAPCGHACFVIALYAEGQRDAQEAAEQLVRRELELRQSVQRNRQAIRKRAYPSLAHKLGGFLDVVRPQIPADWYQEVLHGGGLASEPRYVERLPDEVALAVRNYTEAKRSLQLLNGRGHSPEIIDATLVESTP